MKDRTFLTIWTCLALWVTPLMADGNNAALPHSEGLNWGTISKEFASKSEFFVASHSGREKDNDESINYVFEPGQVIVVPIPSCVSKDDLTSQITIHVAVDSNDSWGNAGELTAKTEPNGIMLDGIENVGFCRLSYNIDAKDKESKEIELYAIISSDWKKDILAFCRENRRAIETNPDTALIRSSIAVGHFDFAMELISKGKRLSGKILLALAEASKNKRIYESGDLPELLIGTVNKIRLKRFQGAPIAEFAVYIPPDYADDKKWPIYLHPDKMRWSVGKYGNKDMYVGGFHEGMIDIWWYTTRYYDLRWDDYISLVEILKGEINLDSNRAYVYGRCGNAFAAMYLGLLYPDQWAEINVDTGGIVTNVAFNAINLAINFTMEGHRAEDDFTSRQDFARKLFQYNDCSYYKDFGVNAIFNRLPTSLIKKDPNRVIYASDTHDRPGAYWVEINGRIDENLPAIIDANVVGKTISVKTENVDAYTLNLQQAPIDMEQPIKIIENEKTLRASGKVFIKKSSKYDNAKLVKNKNIHGPVIDVFNDPFVIVWGTDSEDKDYVKQSENLAKTLSRDGPQYTDKDFPTEMEKSHNLVLIGTPQINSIYGKIDAELPIQIKEGGVCANGHLYNNQDLGFFMVYPNPFNSKKYIAVLYAGTTKALSRMSETYKQMGNRADICVYEILEDKIQYRIFERFDTTWKWHQHWDDVLAVLQKKHPNWQWRQWIMKSVKEHFHADAMLCGDPVAFSYMTPTREIKCRDLFNYLNNYWLVKIKLKGVILKELLSSTFQTDKNERNLQKRDFLLLDGIKFVKDPFDTESIVINEIVADKEYTLVISADIINSLAAGFQFKEYEIIDDGDLIPLLKDCLKNPEANLDTELNSMKINIF